MKTGFRLALLCVAAVLIRLSAEATETANSGEESHITRLVISGNRMVGAEELSRLLGLTLPAPPDSILIEGAADGILARYREEGFLRARVVTRLGPSGDGGRELELVVAEGERTALDTLALEGCRGIPCPRVRRELALRRGRPVAGPLVERDLERILRLYEEEGYPFARITPAASELSPSGDGLSLTLRLEEGARVRVAGLEVRGNRITKETYIKREMMITSGELYRQSRIDRARERLARTGLFRRVGEVGLRPEGGRRKVMLELEVEEGAMNSLEAAAGYVPKVHGGGEGYLTGRFDLRLGNIAGTGRRAEFHWRRLAPESAGWRLGYREPWLAGLPLAVEAELHQEVRDSTYTTRGVVLILSLPVSFSLELELRGNGERTTTGVRGFGVKEESRRWELGGGILWDRRDRRVNPREGGYVTVRAGWARRRVERETEEDEGDSPAEIVEENRIELAGGFFLPTGSGRVLALEGELRETRSPGRDVPFYELFFLGGADGPRGYAEDQFAGSRVGRGSLEERFLLGPRSRFHLFLDVGYDEWRAKGTWHWGYGAGLRLDSRLGLVGLDLGLALGESLGDGLVHVRLTEEW